jgi:hypothetical protein
MDNLCAVRGVPSMFGKESSIQTLENIAKDGSKLRNVRLEFLPTNTTSVLQSMDQGIFRSLKHKYCRCLDCKFLQRITATKECFKIFLFGAIAMLAASWNAVSKEAIKNFCQKARFCETLELHNEDDEECSLLGYDAV